MKQVIAVGKKNYGPFGAQDHEAILDALIAAGFEKMEDRRWKREKKGRGKRLLISSTT